MNTQQITLRVPPDLLAQIDEKATKTRLSRADLIRMGMQMVLGQSFTEAAAEVRAPDVQEVQIDTRSVAQPKTQPRPRAVKTAEVGPHRHVWGGLKKPYICKLCGADENEAGPQNRKTGPMV